ncbi:MAG: ribosome maturation factor RimP [Desulfobacteraceae bacterium]|nr:ribosome maturation factor RimP [Desulfobacteraceae bacterium]MBC2719738.1 ribosome maturation factor RimP [Desulfobacteraceae bacterium]
MMKLQRNKRNKVIKSREPELAAIKFSPKNKENFIAKVKDLTEPLCEAMGMEIVHVEYQRESRGFILRIYIDKPGGITLDDCVFINRQLSDTLDLHFDSSDSYSLEVSSPGSDRPLNKKPDFEKFRGRVARIKTIAPINGQKNFKGVLLGISEEIINISLDDKTVAIPFKEVKSARLVNKNI